MCAEATDVTPASRTLALREAHGAGDRSLNLEYDVLVVAIGARTQTFGIPGADIHAYPLKESSDARAIRARIVQQVKGALLPGITREQRKRILSFVIVGGGPTGIKCAGEISDMVRREFYNLSPELGEDTSITVIDAGKHILSAFNKALRSYTMRVLAKQKIKVGTDVVVQEVRSDTIVLTCGEVIPAGTAIWSAGVTSQTFAHKSSFVVNERGRIIVDSRLQVSGWHDVFALGDCAVVANKNYPMTAQVAQQQGKYLGKALNDWANGKIPKPFWYLHQGMLAYIGSGKGLADTAGGGIRGWLAWVMWRSVYFTKLVSLRNKVLVLFDWCKARCLGRDLSSF